MQRVFVVNSPYKNRRKPALYSSLRCRCACLLYTSDAADERSSVDLGGRRIIKKKKSGEHVVDPIIIQKKTTTIKYIEVQMKEN